MSDPPGLTPAQIDAIRRVDTADGTDAGAMPVFADERRVLGLPASQWPSIIAPIAIGVLALGAVGGDRAGARASRTT